MSKENYNVIGIMSGTSLDGVDLAYVSLMYKEGNWSFKLHEVQTIPYDEAWINRLQAAIDFDDQALARLNKDYTSLLSGIINDFIISNKIVDIDVICSHGHTILHQPQNGFTLQIGNLQELASHVNSLVVCDFRVQDVVFGGQGAPLVPIGDRLLFSEYDFCLNLGGFSNISFEVGKKRIAYDICPVNTVLNHYANILGHAYDDGGKIAASGTVDSKLLGLLNNLDYYKEDYPKSLGFEFVKEVVLPIMDNSTISVKDKLCTFVVHSAMQIAKAVLKERQEGNLLITGGGVYNSFLIEKLEEFMPSINVTIPDNKTIEYKEALIFALLGVLKLRGETNVLCSVTGAKNDHSSGVVFKT
ncbi:MAG: anhydro-N-acetylmuramic acid kinase [Flavobacterium sp. MedPE-SWcel]|uniref:anhydro-N-acetylmuramic acid kinase n=1 Tax=uncultured Flavobacterium sp. TaxID=165435 RepID=UPI0009219C22|nr:anhydro-N-acetylmuramic acid kinase [uncultured Flavobacterium sp.]OIQ21153.1 MAG: anhydro-N-acetylmuramic acid kinase [Flavobacterium sp. MedPE-SWcel]